MRVTHIDLASTGRYFEGIDRISSDIPSGERSHYLAVGKVSRYDRVVGCPCSVGRVNIAELFQLDIALIPAQLAHRAERDLRYFRYDHFGRVAVVTTLAAPEYQFDLYCITIAVDRHGLLIDLQPVIRETHSSVLVYQDLAPVIGLAVDAVPGLGAQVQVCRLNGHLRSQVNQQLVLTKITVTEQYLRQRIDRHAETVAVDTTRRGIDVGIGQHLDRSIRFTRHRGLELVLIRHIGRVDRIGPESTRG